MHLIVTDENIKFASKNFYIKSHFIKKLRNCNNCRLVKTEMSTKFSKSQLQAINLNRL